MQVPFFRVDEALLKNGSLVMDEIDKLFEDCEFSKGPSIRRLESAVSEYSNAPEVVAVGNATDALAIALRALGVGSGDEVIVPAYTFFASASSIRHVGATPVFVDIDPITYSMDPDDLQRRISPRTKAIMPVHLFSQMADMDRILAIARDNNVKVIEDSAEGIGMRFGGTHAGLVGDIGVLSFFPTKTLGGFGDGGAILTNDPVLAETCRSLRNHGASPWEPGTYLHLGYNSRMDGIQAAILMGRLKSLDQEIRERASLADMYSRLLGPLGKYVKTPTIAARRSESTPVYYVYLIEMEDRDGLRDYLSQKGIGTETYYPIPLHLQPAFSDLGYGRGDFPISESVCQRSLALPLFAGLREQEVEQVCEAIKTFYCGE